MWMWVIGLPHEWDRGKMVAEQIMRKHPGDMRGDEMMNHRHGGL